MKDEKDLMKNPFMSNMKFLEQAKEETEFERIIKILLVPSKCGIYISRYNIRDMGRAIGVDIPIKDRKFMLKDLFIYAKQLNKMKEFLDTIIDFINYRIDQYRWLEENYPRSKTITQKWIKKAESLKQFIENMKKEVDIYKHL
jgi:hypothetical protein